MKEKLTRIALLVTLVFLVVAMSFYAKTYSMNVSAATDDGSDVHAPSMSVDSGEEPITDPQTTVAPGRESAETDDSEEAPSAPGDTALEITAGASFIVLLGIVVFVIKKK